MFDKSLDDLHTGESTHVSADISLESETYYEYVKTGEDTYERITWQRQQGEMTYTEVDRETIFSNDLETTNTLF